MRMASIALLFLPCLASAQGYDLYLEGNYSTADPAKYFKSLREYEKDKEIGVCFPFGCGGIQGPFRNPDLNAREPENLTSCMYDTSGVLLYEREGKVCPYKWQASGPSRIEMRRQQWLKAHK